MSERRVAAESRSQQGVVAVVPNGGELLVIRRSQLVVAPGAHCFPGGGVEAGETEELALARELNEELGCQILPQRRLWTSVTPWGVALAWWLASLPKADSIQANPAEVADWRWCSPAEIRLLPDLLESNHHFLDAWERGEFSLEL